MMKLLVFALFALASAFNVAPLAVRRAPVAVTMGVAEIAADCLEEGCPIDMVAELIAELNWNVLQRPVDAQLAIFSFIGWTQRKHSSC